MSYINSSSCNSFLLFLFKLKVKCLGSQSYVSLPSRTERIHKSEFIVSPISLFIKWMQWDFLFVCCFLLEDQPKLLMWQTNKAAADVDLITVSSTAERKESDRVSTSLLLFPMCCPHQLQCFILVDFNIPGCPCAALVQVASSCREVICGVWQKVHVSFWFGKSNCEVKKTIITSHLLFKF